MSRSVASVSRFLDPDQALAAQAGEGLAFVESRPLGGTWALDGLWHRLGIDTTMRRLLAGRRLDPSAEQVLFALVANRALAPSSKLAAAGWASDDVAIPGLAATSDDACYRAMDWLLEIHHELEHEVFGQVADLLNLEVYLLFFFFRDTTSTYFELDEPDEPIPRDQRGVPVADGHGQGAGDTGTDTAGFRSYGHSKDHRDDLPQIVVGMAVTRTGIPVRVWCWPGNTGDQALIRQVKQDLRDWTLTRVIWVADRGFASAANRRWLGYKQLLQVERDWRDMKQVLDLRPVYHRKEERIRAHVLLCWLALLLVRTIETSCDDTWPNLRHQLERVKLGTFIGPAGTFRQRTEITSPQRAILAKLQLAEPPRVRQLTPTAPAS